MRTFLCSLVVCGSLCGAAESARAETRPLSLEEALRIARSQSPVLKKAEAQAQAASARGDGALGRLLPQVTANGSWQHTTDNFVPRPGFAGTPPQMFRQWNFVNAYAFTLAGTQLLYDFSSIDLYRAQREDARAQDDLQRAAVLTTEFAVRNAFFQARTQRELIEVADKTLANQEKHLAQVEAFVEVGTRPEIDLAQSRTDVANARVQLLRAQHGYATARENLKLVMGVSGTDEYDVNAETLAPLAEETLDSERLLQLANRSRPELAALSRQLEAQRLRTSAAKGRFGPAINANGNLSTAGVELDNLRTNVFVGLSASWSLLQSGGTFAAIHEQQANQRGLEADMSALTQRIRVELEQARLTIEAAKAALGASDEALSAAQARLGLAEGRYEAGVGNAIELGDAQLALTGAAAQRVQMEYNLAIARAQLLAALGKSL
ncbi:MAG TPA: TolC family protein [Polyangiales bacterium]